MNIGRTHLCLKNLRLEYKYCASPGQTKSIEEFRNQPTSLSPSYQFEGSIHKHDVLGFSPTVPSNLSL